MSHPDKPHQEIGDSDPAVAEPASDAAGDRAPPDSEQRVDVPATIEPARIDPAARARPHRLGLVLAIAALVLIVDQITKIIVVANLTPGESPKILGGLVYFSLIRNAGAAWSIGAGTGMTWILAIVACVVVVVIIRMASRLRSGLWATCLGLILGGAVGNLMDRIFRSPGVLRGHVVDFISVFGPNAEHFPVFNVADSGITVGGVLLVLTALLGIEFDGSRTRRKSDDAPAAGGKDAGSDG